MARWTYAATKAGYTNLWNRLEIKQSDFKAADRFTRLIFAAEDRYKKIERATGVPWFFIGALHMRESSCNFDGVLHNGQRIIGRGKKTTIEPKGRGPFSTWEEAAIDALKLKNLHKITEWDIARIAYHAELFNGLGYTNRGVNSPYLWAGSNIEQRGKYVRDHVWDKDFDDPQIGVMTVIKRICQLRPDVAESVKGKFVAPLPDVEPADPKERGTVGKLAKSKTAWSAIGAFISSLAGVLTDWRVAAVIVVGVLAAYIIYERSRKE